MFDTFWLLEPLTLPVVSFHPTAPLPLSLPLPTTLTFPLLHPLSPPPAGLHKGGATCGGSQEIGRVKIGPPGRAAGKWSREDWATGEGSRKVVA